jgi:hypothetical protein
MHVAAVPEPGGGDLRLQTAAHVQGQVLEQRRGQFGAGAAIGRSIEGFGRPGQGEGEDDVTDGLATGAIGAEHLAEKGPQGQQRRPQGGGPLAKGDLLFGEALLDLLRVEEVGQRQSIAIEERRAGVVALESLGWNRREWHGSPPCFIF